MTTFATTHRARNRLLVFARYPELGRVKTRLARELGPGPTLDLYRAMVLDLLDNLGSSGPDLEIEIGWTGGDETPGRVISEFFRGHSLFMQSGNTLGDRLTVAMTERVFFHAAEKVIVIGSDDPAITRELIDTAFRLLDSCEWVIGPAHDGGYYLLGTRGASFRTSVFHDISWGESTVYADTLKRIRELNGTLAVLPRRRDIDHLSDLQTFLASAEATSRVLAAAKTMELTP